MPSIKRHVLIAKTFDRKGRQISVGLNSYTKTHPLQLHFATLVGEPYKDKLHAEIHALLRAGDKQVHTISVERYHTNGDSAFARPCASCMLAIKNFGVKFIRYTTSEGVEVEKVE